MQCRRAVTTQAAAGGRACPALKNTVACNMKTCAVDCAVSAWSSWSVCSRSCGGGSHARSRKVISPARFAGKECPYLGETTKCGTMACPADCVTSGWQAWSSCSHSCGIGQRKRERRIVREIEHGGARCPALTETAACHGGAPCPITLTLVKQLRAKYCAVRAWGSWSQCTRTCAGGVSGRMRTPMLPFPRAVLQSLERKDSELRRMVGCPALREQRRCNDFACTLGARCNTEHVRCEVKVDAQHRMHLHIVHDKPASWKMPSHLADLGNFKCSRVRAQQPAALAVTAENVRRLSADLPAPGCRCECNKHQGCHVRAGFVLTNAVLPGNALQAASADLCCEKCTNHPRCACWTFHAGERLCELKRGAPVWLALSAKEGADATVSGVRAHAH